MRRFGKMIRRGVTKFSFLFLPVLFPHTPAHAVVLNGKESNFDQVVQLAKGVDECSGTVIGVQPDVVLTAAQCLNSKKEDGWTIFVKGKQVLASCERSPFDTYPKTLPRSVTLSNWNIANKPQSSPLLERLRIAPESFV